jgi:acetyl esterase/lipase
MPAVVKRLLLFLPWLCLSGGTASAAEIILWPDGVPEPRVPAEPAEKVEVGKDGIARRSHVSNPRLVVHDIPRTDSEALRPAVIVVPGGGFSILADAHEGSDVCRWFNERGFVAFVLLYRVPTGTFDPANAGPVLDAQKAVSEVRGHAAEFGIDPAKIALLGFSAGGQTALVAAANPPRFERAGGAASARPDAVVLVYPWKVAGADGTSVRSDVTIGADTPPMFILQSADDKTSPPQAALTLYAALLDAKVPAELHVYGAGGHGFGMQQRNGGRIVGDWPNRVLEWLRGRGF